jgi:hypothetical protein
MVFLEFKERKKSEICQHHDNELEDYRSLECEDTYFDIQV